MAELYGMVKFQKDPVVGFDSRDLCYWDERRQQVTNLSHCGAFIGRAHKPAPVGDRFVTVDIHIATCKSGPIVTLPDGWSSTPIPPPSVAMIELKESCYAATLLENVNATASVHQATLARWRNNLRDLLRCHRFDVFAWLMQQGVQIPAELIADNTHPTLGNQSPDRAAPVSPPAS